MKKTILDTLRPFNRNLRNPVNRAPSPCLSFMILSMVVCFAFVPMARAQLSPPPDGDYPNGTTAEGFQALFNVDTTVGIFNTALGWVSLWTNTDASFSTGVGAGTLFNNNGADNTAVGAAALFFNTTALTTQPLERMRLGTTLPTGTQPLALLRSSPTPPGVPWKQGFSVFLTLVLTRPSVSAR